MWYSKGMKLPPMPSLLLFQEDEELANTPNHYHKVEKMWRYDRNQFHEWNTTTTNVHTPPPPILVVGLPKAGTSSLFEFFSCHGIYAQHWYCCGPQTGADLPGSKAGPRFGPSYMSHCLLENLQEQARQREQANSPQGFDSKWNHSILDGCGDYHAYTELNGPYIPSENENETDPFRSSKGIFLPQHYHLEELHAAAPTATWILNVRDVKDWIRSVQNVPARSLVERLEYEVLVRHASNDKYQQYNDLKDYLMKRKTTTLRGKSNSTKIPRWKQEESFLRDFWYDHIQRIQDFVKHHDEHHLIVVNISNPDAGSQLSADLWGDDSHRVAKPIRTSPSRTKFCWKRYNAGEYQHDRNE